MSRTKKIAILAIIAMVLTLMPAAMFAATADSTRLSGANRIETALDIASAGTWGTTVVLAPADQANLVDALAAAPLAGQENAPVLLTFKGSLDAAVKAKIIALGATKVYVVGAISDAVAAEVDAISGVTVETLKGAGRVATADAVNAKLTSPAGTFVVGFDAIPDALSVASYAAKNKFAIVLANANGTVSSTLVGTTKYIIGGATKVADIAGVTRISGADRFATNSAVASTLAFTYDRVYVANGLSCVDALAVAPLAAKYGAFVALASGSDVAAAATVNAKMSSTSKTIAVGGTSAVSDAVAGKVAFATPATLAASSVKIINARQIQIVFNKNVDKTTFVAIAVTNIAPAGAAGALTNDLGEDGKTLTITTANTLSKIGNYRVDIVGVQDLDKNTIAPYSVVLALSDTVVPTVTKTVGVTSASNTMSFKIYFSEPVLLDLVKVGSVVSGAVANATYSDTYTVTLPASADAMVAGQTYNVTINGLRDFADNYAASSVTTTVTIVQDTVKPTFTVNAISPTQFSVVFSEDMDQVAAVPVDAIVVKDTTVAKNVLPLAGLPAWKANDKRTLMVTLLATPIIAGDTSANVNVTVANLKDVPGNTVTTATSALTLSKETVKPTITAVRMIPLSNNQIEVTFSEWVTGIAAIDFVLQDSDKAAAGGVITPGAIDVNNKVILALGTALTKTDNYNLALKVNGVTDASGNNNDGVALTVVYTAPPAAQLTAAITNTYDGATAVDSTAVNRIVWINFNQADVVNGINSTTGAYKTGAADNPLNYTLDGAALPVGTTVAFQDGLGPAGVDAVTLNFSAITDLTKLPAGLVEGGKAVVTVSNVKTIAGSTIQYTSTEVTVLDKTVPTIKQAYLTGSNATSYVVTLVMSEKMSATNIADFVLSVGATTPAAATVAVSATDATKILITVSVVAEKAKIAAAPATLTVHTAAGPLVSADQAAVANLLAPIAAGAAKTVTNYSN